MATLNNGIQKLIESLETFLSDAQVEKDRAGRSDGGRLLAIAVTEAEKALAVLCLARQRGLL